MAEEFFFVLVQVLVAVVDVVGARWLGGAVGVLIVLKVKTLKFWDAVLVPG